MSFIDYFRKKKEVPSRQPSPAPSEGIDKDGFVLLSPSPEEIAGTSPHQTQVADYMKAVRDAVSKNPEQDGPINWNAGVPFRLSPTLEMIWSTSGESKFVRPKIKNVDWDSFEYSFQLEKSVLES